MRYGNSLSSCQQLQLIKTVTKEDIWLVLIRISDMKAPRHDQLNVCFFIKTWSVVGDNITSAMINFFNTTKMYHTINCTTITLIPKVKNSSSPNDFRPISCCTIVYKLISKVLTLDHGLLSG